MQTLQKAPEYDTKNELSTDIANLQKSMQNLQQEVHDKNEEILSLQTVKTNLETNLNRFVKLHTEEKNERKELMAKVEKYASRYNLLLGICAALTIVIVVFLAFQYLPINLP